MNDNFLFIPISSIIATKRLNTLCPLIPSSSYSCLANHFSFKSRVLLCFIRLWVTFGHGTEVTTRQLFVLLCCFPLCLERWFSNLHNALCFSLDKLHRPWRVNFTILAYFTSTVEICYHLIERLPRAHSIDALGII